MPSKREQVLSALFHRLRSVGGAIVRRNEVLPADRARRRSRHPARRRSGRAGRTLNPRTEFYSHRAEIEAFVTQPVGGGGEADFYTLVERIGSALRADLDLGGKAENLDPVRAGCRS